MSEQNTPDFDPPELDVVRVPLLSRYLKVVKFQQSRMQADHRKESTGARSGKTDHDLN